MSVIRSLAELDAIYGEPVPLSITKEVDHLTDEHRAYVAAAPFVVVASAGPGGLDCSPRGDPGGFVRVQDERTLLMPDRRGNNRVDTLRNLVHDPRIALLFLVPGVNVTLRVNGTAEIDTDEELRAGFAMGAKLPASVIRVTTTAVFTQCPKALVRSHLWDPARYVDPADLPSVGQILAALAGPDFDPVAHDASTPERIKATIY